ncbi:methylmalonyl-CoA mutase, partial [Chloroflexota bacterium]
EKSRNRFYTPLDIKDHNFLKKVGFPGEYPFTSGLYPTSILDESSELLWARGYSGYGTPEDTRDYYNLMISRGRQRGPNLPFDLPTQCGYDSDDPMACGEVGRTGIAMSTLRDMEVVFEAFTGDSDLDKIRSSFAMNGPCNIILAMYIALAQKRGIPLDKLRVGAQNDILKEYVARGNYIFPPKPSMRMTRDSLTYCTEYLPRANTIQICGYHMRHAGASLAQELAFTFADGIAYVQTGIDAGLDVDVFVPRFHFNIFGGGPEFFKQIAQVRAGRRMWAKIMREKFGAKNPRSWILRTDVGASIGEFTKTVQRPLNNLIRSVIGGVAGAITGGLPGTGFPYDEPLGLGHSLEAHQLNLDAMRVILFEARLGEVLDPLAGSYYVESLTDDIEVEAWDILEKVNAMGGAVAAIEQGYMQREIAKNAYEYQQEIERGERVLVGVNKFTGENELEVTTRRVLPHPYDPAKREEAEQKQIANLAKVKRERDNAQVEIALGRLRKEASDESVNLIPVILEAVKTYASVGEICDVLREVFGEYQAYGVGI